MGTYRTTWNFAGPQGATWEEVWDVQAGSIALSIPGAERGSLARYRMALAHKSVSLQSISALDLENPDLPPFPVAINLSGTANNQTGIPANTDEAAVINVVCVSEDATVFATRKWWLRGLEETAVSRDENSGADVLSPDFSDNLSRFFSKIRDLVSKEIRFGMRPRTRSSWEGPLFRYGISSIAGNVNQDFCVLTLSEDPGWVRGQRIQINDASKKHLPGLRGIFTILEVAGNLITIRYRVPQAAPPASGYAYVLLRENFLTVMAARSAFAFLGSRQTKKPVTHSRGRRSASKLRR